MSTGVGGQSAEAAWTAAAEAADAGGEGAARTTP